MAPTPYASELRRRAEALVRDTDHSLARISREVGVPRSTLSGWSKDQGWRPLGPPPPSGRAPPPSRRRGAVERLYRIPAVATSDLAVAIGVPRREAAAYFRGCGFEDRRTMAVREPPRESIRTRTLRRTLRIHIARQIARFDAALDGAADEGAARLDSAKVLRDLGGLKRLIDEIETDERERGDGKAGHDKSGSAEARPILDLPALRAQIAHRYAAFAGERPDAGLPIEPAA